MKNTVSLRIHYRTWVDPQRNAEQLDLLRAYPRTLTEVAFFTSDTHPALPLAEVQRRAAILETILPAYKTLGLKVGINHLATIGHLDENPENSLQEPWQKLMDMSGNLSASCYCAADPAVQEYILQSYRALAQAGPQFLWIDDDVRLESHAKAVNFACFCPRCLAEFSASTGRQWDRQTLLSAFKDGSVPDRLHCRRLWIEHNRRSISRILRLARQAVDAVSPGIILGLMTGEISYSGLGYDSWAKEMAGPSNLDVKFRPGGGFYTDDHPASLLQKLHSVGRQNAFVPAAIRDIQYEHENFPYIVLNKSRAVYTAEIAGAIAAGCTGVALNTLGISGDPIAEFRPYFDAVQDANAFYDQLVETCGSTQNEGIWAAFEKDHIASLGIDDAWPGPGAWGSDFHALNEVFSIGLPPSYTANGAKLTLLQGDNVLEWSIDQLRHIFKTGVMLDGAALQRLSQLGLADLAGWEIVGTREADTLERFTADPLNGKFAGWHRDARPSFWPRTTQLLKPLSLAARSLATAQDFTPRDYGCCAGVFENPLGGRVAVLGYYPWNFLGSLAKTTQFRNLTRWISRDQLPGYIDSHHRIALWARRDSAGHSVFILINASIDPAEGAALNVLNGCDSYESLDMKNARTAINSQTATTHYRSLHLPTIPPWSALLVRPH